MEDTPLPLGDGEPHRDFTKMLDLNRTELARMRVSDKREESRKKLEALHRVSRAVGVDLFDFAGVSL